MIDHANGPAGGRAGDPAGTFEVSLRDGRAVEISPMGGTDHESAGRLGWTATLRGRRQPGSLGLAWFAPVPAAEGQALAEVVVSPGLEGTGLGLLLFDTVVLTAMSLGVKVLTVFLPRPAEDFFPVLASAGGRVLSALDGVIVAAIPVGQGPRRFVGSGTHQAPGTV